MLLSSAPSSMGEDEALCWMASCVAATVGVTATDVESGGGVAAERGGRGGGGRLGEASSFSFFFTASFSFFWT